MSLHKYLGQSIEKFTMLKPLWMPLMLSEFGGLHFLLFPAATWGLECCANARTVSVQGVSVFLLLP